MIDLIKQYRDSLRNVRNLQLRADDLADRKVLSGMASDLQFAIEWMRTGRRPGNRRGAERLAAYQREKPIDPIVLQNYYSAATGNSGAISESDKKRIEEALQCLTRLEREIYLMARGQCLSRSEIARLLGIGKGTVNNVLTRADKKLLKYQKICRPTATYM